MKRVYIVRGIHCLQNVRTVYGISKLNLSWADGMIGVLPVFSNLKKAKKYANGKYEIDSCFAEVIKK